MIDDDDLEEINLAPDRVGSARQIRSGKARAAKALSEARRKPLWKRQLMGGKNAQRVVSVTLPQITQVKLK